MHSLDELPFDNSYARLPDAFRQRVDPTAVPDPHLVAFNPDAAALIDLDPNQSRRLEFAQAFAGNAILPGSEPVAMKYAGHQFGTYVPQLGDGRAILLGEVRNSRGERWDLHLKGAGPTAFSRFGDGRAVLRSSIREYLACEAMHALGVPTTRALCIVGSPLEVYREGVESAALIVRMAPSHVRFGSFEVFAHRGQESEVRTLADYVIELHFPHLKDSERKYIQFFGEVVRRTARLVANWQAVGFAHGVLNTDNMSVLGLTLDYGPYGFVEAFDPGFICNHSDETGRYAFDQQPRIGYWNLAQFGRTLLSLMSMDEAKSALECYVDEFNRHIQQLMAAKLGLVEVDDSDAELWRELLDVMADGRVDYTNVFRALSDLAAARPLFPDSPRFDAWAERYRERLRRENSNDIERKTRMDRANPKFVLRNYLAQAAIERAERGDFTEIERLHQLLRTPFDDHPGMEAYTRPGRTLVVSCSS